MSEKSALRQVGLGPNHIALMRRLANGPEADAVGLEIHEMTEHELQSADHLTGARIAEVVPGWRMTFWYRLTSAGREMLHMLSAMGH